MNHPGVMPNLRLMLECYFLMGCERGSNVYSTELICSVLSDLCTIERLEVGTVASLSPCHVFEFQKPPIWKRDQSRRLIGLCNLSLSPSSLCTTGARSTKPTPPPTHFNRIRFLCRFPSAFLSFLPFSNAASVVFLVSGANSLSPVCSCFSFLCLSREEAHDHPSLTDFLSSSSPQASLMLPIWLRLFIRTSYSLGKSFGL